MNREKEFLPWKNTNRKTKDQLFHQSELNKKYGLVFGDNCYISPLAEIYDTSGKIGDDTVVGAGALIRTAELITGKNCSINTYVYMQGKIRLGDNVRIGPKANIIACNHGHFDITVPIDSQDGVINGVCIGNDVWIGTNSVILDGVKIGSHSVIGAGSVVTKDVPDYSIVCGNPATIKKNRLEEYFKEKLKNFCSTVDSQIEHLIDIHKSDGKYIDLAAHDKNVNRPLCDAIEILCMFDKENHITDIDNTILKLQNLQTDKLDYNILCIGYALENLGSHFKYPFICADELKGEKLTDFLENLPWQDDAWKAGSIIDSLGTALYHNKKYFKLNHDIENLFCWLENNINENYGMWGKSNNIHDMVNGFYRLTRGTYAQFSKNITHAKQLIDTVLNHSKTILADSELETACNVLDIIHPLWLARKVTDYRSIEVKELAVVWINRIIEKWVSGNGFAFVLSDLENPSLMGTEMWLSILYIMCDYLGIEHLLNFSPKGVHRLHTEIF